MKIEYFKYVKKKVYALIILVLIQTSVFGFENEIIVKIDNEIITKIDIYNEVKYLSSLNPNLKNLDKNNLFQIAKSSLIREKIKEIEISKMDDFTINQNYLENIISNIYENIGLKNEEEFINYINLNNIDMLTIRKKLSYEAFWNQIIYKKFFAKIKIDKEKIKKDIQENKKKLK